MNKPTSALNAVNFFMADVRDSLGSFLGIFLQGRGWQPSEIGIVMTVGGLAGMLATTPIGMLVDATRAKRTVNQHAKLTSLWSEPLGLDNFR